ncbi:MAG: recombination protein O N-terminal domain-containing protein [Lentisphaeria bacterium]|nr:MAG: recombination protein O N-terminal domain-containing protein [Lentisphaeria bacterium]
MVVSTQLIVLSKQSYRESSLLLAGLSPDCGRLSLVANGAQKLSAKNFPAVDLFRELEVEFDDGGKATCIPRVGWKSPPNSMRLRPIRVTSGWRAASAPSC